MIAVTSLIAMHWSEIRPLPPPPHSPTKHIQNTCRIIYTIMHTVRTFNSCTRRPDVCPCLVVQTPMDIMSQIYEKHIEDPRSLRLKATFSCKGNPRIHAQENRCQSGVRSSILPGLLTHLVQELNVGTVGLKAQRA